METNQNSLSTSKPMPHAEWVNVFSHNALRGFNCACTTPVTFLIDGDDYPSQPAAWALRTLAGQVQPTHGKIRVFERDPYREPNLRKTIALLGDDWLFKNQSLDESFFLTLGKIRGLEQFSTRESIHKTISELASSLSVPFRQLSDVSKNPTLRLALSDLFANLDQAHLILWSYPEHYAESAGYDKTVEKIQQALKRNTPVVIATTRLESTLMLAHDFQSQAALVLNGRVAATHEAHSLPWLLPLDGITTRMIQVTLDASETSTYTSAQFAADLLNDSSLAHTIARIEMISSYELLLHVHDPRLVAKALTYRAHEGVPIAQLSVHGVPTSLLASTYSQAYYAA